MSQAYFRELVNDSRLEASAKVAILMNDPVRPATAPTASSRKTRKKNKKAAKIAKRAEARLIAGVNKNTAINSCVKAAASYGSKTYGGNRDFYKSREWQEVRCIALRRHGASCQCCGATRKDGKVIHVDHIKPRSKFPSLALDIDNLQILCEDCNMGKSNKDATDWRQLNQAIGSNNENTRMDRNNCIISRIANTGT